MRQPSLWACPNWCCRLGAQLADKNGNVVFAFVFWVGSDLLFSYLCKSSSPFEEDPNPWLGEEREKKEEEEAVKDYFLNITNSHHTTVSDDEHRVMMMLIHYKRYCPKIVIP